MIFIIIVLFHRLSIEKSALVWLADTCDGDARIALTNLQLVLQHNTEKNTLLSVEDIKDGIKVLIKYDFFIIYFVLIVFVF